MKLPTPHPRKLLISEIGSERATQDFGNKIVTHEGKTHVAWQDSTEEGYFNRIRTYDHGTGKLSESVTLNMGVDNHARPILTIDHGGTLHIIMSGHGSPMAYRGSVRPNDASEWTEEEPVGSGTYPVIHCGPDNTLYLTMRNSEGWNGSDLYGRRAGGAWQKKAKLVKRTDRYEGYAGYQNGFAMAPDGTLHMVCDFYEPKGIWEQYGLEKAVCYMSSRDGAETWEKADGTAIGLPARPEQMDLLAHQTEPFDESNPDAKVASNGAIAVDSAGRPVVFYVSHLEKRGELIVASPDSDGNWERRRIDVIEKTFPNLGPRNCDRATTRGEDGTIFLLLALGPRDEERSEGKMRMVGCAQGAVQLIWLISEDGARTWSALPALESGTDFNLANVERRTGAHPLPPGQWPPFIYCDGLTRDPKEGEVIQNNVYLVLSN